MVNKLLGLPTNTAHTSELQQSDTVQPQLQRDAPLSKPRVFRNSPPRLYQRRL
jgi:hypothetical protein